MPRGGSREKSGRLKVHKGIQVTLTVTESKIEEVKDFVKKINIYEPKN